MTPKINQLTLTIALLCLAPLSYAQEAKADTIPLARGHEHTPFVVHGVPIAPKNVYVYEQKEDGKAPPLQVTIEIGEGTLREREFILRGNFPNRGGRGGVDFNYPLALGKYSYDIALLGQDNSPALVIDSLVLGQDFYMRANSKVQVGDLEIDFNYMMFSHIMPKRDGTGGGSEVDFLFTLSSEGATKVFSMTYEVNTTPSETLNGYKVWVLDYMGAGDYVKMRVDAH